MRSVLLLLILQMKHLRHKELNELAHGHTACEWQGWPAKPGSRAPVYTLSNRTYTQSEKMLRV